MGYEPDVLARGRALAETRLTETITAGKETPGFDPVTLDATVTVNPVRYTGPARIKYPTTTVSESRSVGADVAAQSVIVEVPVAAAPLLVGDMVVVESSSADPHLAGRRYRVTGRPQSGQVTLHRYPVEEIS